MPDRTERRPVDPVPQVHDELGRFVTKLTPETHARIVRSLASGVPVKDATAGAGVWRSTFKDWMKRGEAALAHANHDIEQVARENPFAAFALDVRQAQARFVLRNMTVITAIGRGQVEGVWQALAWQLEPRFPAWFGRGTRHAITGPDADSDQYQHVIALDPGALERLSPEELRQLREIVAEMGGQIIEADEPLERTPDGAYLQFNTSSARLRTERLPRT